MKKALLYSIALVTCATASLSSADTDPGRAAFRAIYQEMVEIDSSPTTGSCTKVVRAAETRLRAAGFTDEEVHVVIPEGRPDDGNIVARIRAKNAKKKGVLLLAHIDVVDAKREDWERDPFKLIEENGYFYGRGSADDKAMAAVFLDLMIRLKQERNFKPGRDLIMALTCGEETSNRVNGVDHLLKNRRELIDSAFAINEGAGGLLSDEGKPLALQVQAGEKIHQVYSLEVTNPGGHSSRPVPDNAIYRLAAATQKVASLSFPIQVNPVVREYFRVTGPMLGGETGAAMSAVAKNPDDQAALATLMKDPSYNAVVHTTCVATQIDGGHAPNALPQRAATTLSCRVMQGTTPEQVKETLEKAIADPQVKVSIVRRRDGSSPPQLTDEVMGPVKKQAAKQWPDVPIAPLMSAGATDGRFLMNAGIPTYGMSGMFAKPGEANAHGLNEKIRTQSLYDGRTFLEGIVRAYAK
ncbi:acetylornithine deacetylase/succinyl-diaminopimelate desuccinylase-like protein [Povalibacter uvarum]|uniref:Acetylornithine deacetylase/succinyl-diaminopimelate desuccinylase-like protein n=1 Tax=Povalibacter uvarum TaxID=732238 RepID=A0A841HLL7_9GAMM|nr:M20/M25/M40 family metallo-hydrolase [Povalibacter uvarum]MBB6093766.1 acetylornithine deacetylase/succinyl-diaminopimelate desuccinylase-like protein [Povalibacter uvarum]